jgi:hypothetical protein
MWFKKSREQKAESRKQGGKKEKMERWRKDSVERVGRRSDLD